MKTKLSFKCLWISHFRLLRAKQKILHEATENIQSSAVPAGNARYLSENDFNYCRLQEQQQNSRISVLFRDFRWGLVMPCLYSLKAVKASLKSITFVQITFL